MSYEIDEKWEGDNRAYFDVSYELLAQLLLLPEDTEVVRVTHSPDWPGFRGQFRVWVRNPSFPKNLGNYRVSPTYSKDMETGEVSFDGWGNE